VYVVPETFKRRKKGKNSSSVLDVFLKGGGYRSLGIIYIFILIYSHRQALDADPDPGR
jgi:hypothetical protein